MRWSGLVLIQILKSQICIHARLHSSDASVLTWRVGLWYFLSAFWQSRPRFHHFTVLFHAFSSQAAFAKRQQKPGQLKRKAEERVTALTEESARVRQAGQMGSAVTWRPFHLGFCCYCTSNNICVVTDSGIVVKIKRREMSNEDKNGSFVHKG